MGQFSVHANKSPASKLFPYLLDVQHDLFDQLATRVVIPLQARQTVKGKPLTLLTPVVTIAGQEFILLTPQLAGVAKQQLGPWVADLSAHRQAIITALDLLVTGV
ncbi:MAG: CcdB family protein [Azonexus sp.]|jgi:toxin CcdB|nr:CcdB family protein [Azonexus sp.]